MKLMILIIIREGYQGLLNSSWCFLFSITELDRRKEWSRDENSVKKTDLIADLAWKHSITPQPLFIQLPARHPVEYQLNIKMMIQ